MMLLHLLRVSVLCLCLSGLSALSMGRPNADYFYPDMTQMSWPTPAGMEATDFLNGTFPVGFIWATATAAYQIEGAWNVSGKGPSIWDTMSHRTVQTNANNAPGNGIAYNQTGDVACDSYHLYKQDIQLMKNMGVKYYRFSLSWARIFPKGTVDHVNQDGVNYYNNVINALKQNGISPLVTLFHWDLPQALQDMGGFQNSSFPNWFKAYANQAFHLFGDRVHFWITFNEPWITSCLGYGSGVFAPNINTCVGTCPYISTHNIIKAHAQAYHVYNNTYKARQHGQVGITLNIDWSEPGTQNASDKAASERSLQWQAGWFGHAIYKDGDYPQIMKDYIGNKSQALNLTASRLPTFTATEKAINKGTYDFFGLNTYTAHYTINQVNLNSNNYFADANTNTYHGDNWVQGGSNWLYYTPWGTRKLLNWIKNTYNNPPVIITENGWSDNNGTTSDIGRVAYYRGYINNVLKAIKLDGCNVKGYTAWSLMDNMEWARGYEEKFGLHYVNFSDPARPRVPKDSAKFYAQVVRQNGFPQTGGAMSSLRNVSMQMWLPCMLLSVFTVIMWR